MASMLCNRQDVEGVVAGEARCSAQERSVFQESHMEGDTGLLLAPCSGKEA